MKRAGLGAEAAMRRGRRWTWGVLAAVGLLGSAWGLVNLAAGWWARAELARARDEMAAGRFGPARARLVRLSAFRPRMTEVHNQLGLCEEAAGRPDRALAAWARIAPGAPAAAEAAGNRERMLRRFLDRGRFGELEELLVVAGRAEGPAAVEARESLIRLLRFQGRYDEVERLLRDCWASARDPSRPLRELWALESEPLPLGMVRTVLDQAAKAAPDDDRVWLGRANLATWSGRLDEADAWLADCLRRRPADPAVWRARLTWARAAGRPDVAEEALAHLPADRLEPGETLELEAWFAAARGDRDVERRALERLVEETPGDSRALDRLATLAVEAGEADRAAVLRRRKDYADQSRELYRKLLAADATTIDLPTVARLAEALGRWFEARGWWSLVVRFEPGDSEARAALDRLASRFAPRAPSRSLADLAAAAAAVGHAPRSPRPSATVAAPAFSDDAAASGLVFTYDNGQTPVRHLPETMGGGVGLLDYDGDGWLDVYCVQGGPFPPEAPVGPGSGRRGDRLFRNRGDGTFEDVTARSGLSAFPRGYGHGVAVGDFDNDGRPDLFVTRWRSYALYRNRGDGTFADLTATAGLDGDRDWPTSAAWADLDGDGDLDLYVCHYVAYDVDHSLACGRKTPDGSTQAEYCDPRKFVATHDHLFRNDAGRFVDVSAEAGVVDRGGRGLGVVAADLDGDGRVDLYVANDTTANFVFRNVGGLKFVEEGVASGAGASASGGFQAGMGVACGDLDGDGRPDLAVTNFYGESTSLYRNLGGGSFAEESAPRGLAAASRSLLGFGVAFLDFDNDGRPDLASANGHVNDYRPTYPHAMPAQLLRGNGDGRLDDVSRSAGSVWTTPRVGRGLALGDLDNDGRLDLLIVAHDAPLAYVHNRTAGGRFLTLRLEGTASNRDAVGARVSVTSGGRRQVVARIGGGSYLSAADPRLHVGLGQAERVESVEVAWPSGRVDTYRNLAADSGYLLREGNPEATALRGFPPATIRGMGPPRSPRTERGLAPDR